MAAELPFRLSAQVIPTLTDNSRIDTTPTQAALGVITATKGPINELQLIQTTSALSSVFGEPTTDHLSLIAASKIVAAGNAMYLVRVAGEDVAAAVATIEGTRTETVQIGDVTAVSGGDNIEVFNIDANAGSAVGAFNLQYGPSGDTNAWSGTFTPDGGGAVHVLEITVNAEKRLLTLGATGLMASYTNLVVGEWTWSVTKTLAIGPVTVTPPTASVPTVLGSYHMEGTFNVTYTPESTWTSSFIPLASPLSTFPVVIDTVAKTITLEGSGIVLQVDEIPTGSSGSGQTIYQFSVIPSATQVPANVLLTFKELGTYGNQFSVDVRPKSGGGVKDYTIVLYNGSLQIKTYDFTLDETNKDLPYFLELQATEFVVSLEDELSTPESLSLSASKIPFIDGDDGLDSLTASDYIGEADRSNGKYTGSKLFLQPQVVANMYPSLGYTDKEYLAAMNIVAKEKNLTCVYDTPLGLTQDLTINWLENTGPYEEDAIILEGYNCEVYWPWQNDAYNGIALVMPPSTYVVINSLASFQVIGTQMPVAGNPRGIITGVSPVTQVPAVADRDTLITHRINPIYDTGLDGVQIFGNETLNNDYTDLRSAHIGRTVSYIMRSVNRFTSTLYFNLNDPILWQTWMDGVRTIMNPIRDKRGLNWFDCRMGLDTTTRNEISQRMIRGIIGMQFVQDAEVFYINYVVYPSSAESIDF